MELNLKIRKKLVFEKFSFHIETWYVFPLISVFFYVSP